MIVIIKNILDVLMESLLYGAFLSIYNYNISYMLLFYMTSIQYVVVV